MEVKPKNPDYRRQVILDGTQKIGIMKKCLLTACTEGRDNASDEGNWKIYQTFGQGLGDIRQEPQVYDHVDLDVL